MYTGERYEYERIAAFCLIWRNRGTERNYMKDNSTGWEPSTIVTLFYRAMRFFVRLLSFYPSPLHLHFCMGGRFGEVEGDGRVKMKLSAKYARSCTSGVIFM